MWWRSPEPPAVVAVVSEAEAATAPAAERVADLEAVSGPTESSERALPDLEDSRRYVGRLVEIRTEVPIPGATIRYMIEGGPDVETTRSDEQGYFELPMPSKEILASLEDDTRPRTFAVTTEDHQGAILRYEPGHHSRASARIIRLGKLARLELRLTDVEGRGVPHVHVSLACARESVPDNMLPLQDRRSVRDRPIAPTYAWSARTNELGVASFSMLVPDVALHGNAFDQALGSLTLEPGENERTLAVDITTHVTGTVTDQHGLPVDTELALWERDRHETPDDYTYWGDSTTTRARSFGGGYSMLFVPPGSYWLRAANLDVGGKPVPVEVRPSEARVVANLMVWRGVSLAGRTVDGEGKPIPAPVTVRTFVDAADESLDSFRRSRRREEERFERTDRSGTFEFHGLLPGEYEIDAGPYSIPVRAHTGTTNLVVRVGSAQMLRGVVRGGTEDLRLSIDRKRVERYFPSRELEDLPIDADSRFEIELDPGVHEIFAADGDRVAAATVEIDLFQAPDPIELVLAPGREIVLVNDSPTLHNFWVRRGGRLLFRGIVPPSRRRSVHVPLDPLTIETRRATSRQSIEHVLEAGSAESLTVFLENPLPAHER